MFRYALEAFLQSNVPEPPSDISQRFVVIVLERSGDKRRIFIEHVLHAERDGCSVQPRAPSALAISSGADRHHVLFLSVLHLHVLAAVLGVTRHFLMSDWSRHVKRIGSDQIKSCPLPHFTVKALKEVVIILASPVNRGSDIQAVHPTIMRAMIEQTGEGSVTRERTGQGKPGRHKLTGNAKPLLLGINLQFKSGQPRPVQSVGELTKIAVSEDGRIEDIYQLVVETFQDRTSKVCVRIDNERDPAKIRSAIGRGWSSGRRRGPLDQAREIMLNNELCSENRRNRSH